MIKESTASVDHAKHHVYPATVDHNDDHITWAVKLFYCANRVVIDGMLIC